MKPTITAYQAAAVVTSTILGVGVLTLPRLAVAYAGSGGPLVTLMAGAAAGLGLASFVYLGRRFPTQTWFEYGEEVLGPWAGKAAGLLVVLLFVVLSALIIREFGEVVITEILTRTPLEVIVIVLIVLVSSALWNPVSVFARMHEFYLPWIILGGTAIVLLALTKADAIRLQPWWGEGGLAGLGASTLDVAILYQGVAVYGMLTPHLARPDKSGTAAAVGLTLATVLYTMTVAGVLAAFGTGEISRLLWPTLEVAKATSVPGGVLERLDALFIVVWVTAVFTTVLSTHYIAAVGLAQVLEMRDHRVFILPSVPFIYAVAMGPQNIDVLYNVIIPVGQWGLLLTLVYPISMALVAAARGREGDGS